MIALEQLQLYLTLQNDSKNYDEVYQFLKTQESFDESTSKILERLNNGVMPDFPLTDDELKNFPRIFKTQPSDPRYGILIELFNYFVESRKISDKVLVNAKEVLDSIKLQNNVTSSEKSFEENAHINLFFVSLLLQVRLGVGLMEIPEQHRIDTIEKVKKFLNKNKISSLDIPSIVSKPMEILRKYLWHSSKKELRLQAREVCESLQIPLEISQMLSLSLDGIIPNEDLEKKERTEKDVVLVIGTTGSGKSTLINYLCDVEYDCIENSSNGTLSLQPKPNSKVPPAKVGHTAKSQTLYPQLVPGNEFSFCDCPGFDDNRSNEQAICASLGVPLAIQKSKCIRAIIVVIEYNSTDLTASGRGSSFRLLTQTLDRLIGKSLRNSLSDSTSNLQPLPILFAITKPPVPARNGTFLTEKLKKFVLNRITEILKSREDAYAQIEIHEKRINELNIQLNIINNCIVALKAINYDKESSGRGLSRFSRMLVLAATGETQIVETALIEKYISEQAKKWQEEGIQQPSIDKLQNVLRKISKLDEPKARSFIEEQMRVWVQEAEPLQKSVSDVTRKKEELLGEMTIINLMRKASDDIFIIRGYKDNSRDNDDHKIALLNCLRQLRLNNREILRHDFVFNPLAREFTGVRLWAKNLAKKNNQRLRAFLELPNALKTIEDNISHKKDEIVFEKNQLRAILSDVKEKPDELAKETASLRKAIELKTKQIKELDQQRQTLNTRIAEANKKIFEIETSPEHEYGSRFNHEERSYLGSLVGSYTKWDYIFPGGYYGIGTLWEYLGFSKKPEYIVPIQRVELSCVINNQSKLVFNGQINDRATQDGDNFSKVAISDPSVPIKIYNDNKSIIEMQCTKDYKSTGTFQVKVANLTNGCFSAVYYSNAGTTGDAGIRVFVMGKDIPANREMVKSLNESVTKNRAELSKLDKILLEVRDRLKDDQEYLALLENGLGRKQKDKVDRIQKLLFRLKYSEKEFIDEYFTKVAKEIELLKLDDFFNALKSLSSSNEDDFKATYQKDFGVFKIMMGIKDLETQTDDWTKLPHVKLAQIPSNYFVSMYSPLKETGLNLLSVQEILLGFAKFKFNTEKTLKDDLDELNLEKAKLEYCFDVHRSVYSDTRLQYRTLDMVIDLLDFSDNSTIMEYRNLHDLLKARQIYDYKIMLIDAICKQKIQNQLNEQYNENTLCYGLKREILLPEFELISTRNRTRSFLENFYKQGREGNSKYIRLKDKAFSESAQNRTVLIGKLPNNSIVELEEFEALGSGECLFHVMNLERKSAAELLDQLISEEFRQQLSEEISLSIRNGSFTIDEQNLASLRRTSDFDFKILKELLSSKKIHDAHVLKIEAEGNRLVKTKMLNSQDMDLKTLNVFFKTHSELFSQENRLLNDIVAALKKQTLINDDIKKLSILKPMCVEYLKQLQQVGWLGFKTMIFLAKMKQINCILWTRDPENPEVLQVKDKNIADLRTAPIHILFLPDQTHLNLLCEKEADKYLETLEGFATEKLSPKNQVENKIQSDVGPVTHHSSGLNSSRAVPDNKSSSLVLMLRTNLHSSSASNSSSKPQFQEYRDEKDLIVLKSDKKTKVPGKK